MIRELSSDKEFFARRRLIIGLLISAIALLAPLAQAAQPEQETLSVVTLNLWHDKADWPKRQAVIVETLKALQPDVIALQEVLQHEHLRNQATSLAEDLGYHAYFVSVDASDAVRRYGNAILTRHRVIAEDWAALPPPDDYRTVAHLRVAIGTRTLDVYATHLHYLPEGVDIRREQVDGVLAHVRATQRSGPSLVLGDLNTPADAPELAALRARYRDAYDTLHADAAQDAPAHSTLNLAFYPPLRIDHVLFDPGEMSVLEARRLFDQPEPDGTWASDHFGVLARLRFTARRSAD